MGEFFKRLRDERQEREVKMSKEFWGTMIGMGAFVAIIVTVMGLMWTSMDTRFNSVDSRLVRVEEEISALNFSVGRIEGRLDIPEESIAEVR